MRDYYEILGIQRNASDDEIKKAFRRLALENHPDKGGDHERFKEINEAYQVLSDREKRNAYDQFGHAGVGAGGPGGWQNAGAQGFNFDFDMNDMGFGSIDDIFEMMFGGGSRSRAQSPQQGESLETYITISFEEAAFGTEKKISLNRKEVCHVCHGSGAEPGRKVKTCEKCGGTGRTVIRRRTIFGVIEQAGICPACKGKGKIPEKNCHSCKGSGLQIATKEIMVKIPAGITSGTTLRISGEGNQGETGAPAGDLFVRIMVAPHQFFVREGNNILLKHEIDFVDAALGAKATVDTLYGPVSIKIPAGTQSGEVFRVKGKGILDPVRMRVGDQLVTVVVTIPKKLSEKERRLLEELRKKQED